MNYKVDALSVFEKQAKRLSKKYPSLKDDLKILVGMLEENPTTGIALGNNFFNKIKDTFKRKRKIRWCKSNHIFESSKKYCLPFCYIR